MDVGKYSEALLKGKNRDVLQQLADGPDGKRIAEMVDQTALEKAAQQGDTAALSAMLQKVLSTPEGQRLAAQVKRAVKPDG